MKTLVTDYAFNHTGKTITLNNLDIVLKLEQVLLITNTTDNIIIYNFADPNLGGSILNNTITLEYNTTSMSSTDSLQIFVDFPNTNFENLTDLLQQGIAEIVHQLQVIRNDGGMADAAGRVRVAIESGSVGITTNQDLRTVAGLTAIGGLSGTLVMSGLTNQAWGNLRSKIVIS